MHAYIKYKTRPKKELYVIFVYALITVVSTWQEAGNVSGDGKNVFRHLQYKGEKKSGIKSFSKCAKYKVIKTSVQLLQQTGLHTLV